MGRMLHDSIVKGLMSESESDLNVSLATSMRYFEGRVMKLKKMARMITESLITLRKALYFGETYNLLM